MWWYLACLPIAFFTILIVVGRVLWGSVDIDPPRERRLHARPRRRGFPVLMPSLNRCALARFAASSDAKVEGNARRPIPVATALKPEDESAEVRTFDDSAEANPLVIEAALQIGELALDIAEVASDCYREAREAHESVRTPMPAAPRPETAVEAVMELRRKRAEAQGRSSGVE